MRGAAALVSATHSGFVGYAFQPSHSRPPDNLEILHDAIFSRLISRKREYDRGC